MMNICIWMFGQRENCLKQNYYERTKYRREKKIGTNWTTGMSQFCCDAWSKLEFMHLRHSCAHTHTLHYRSSYVCVCVCVPDKSMDCEPVMLHINILLWFYISISAVWLQAQCIQYAYVHLGMGSSEQHTKQKHVVSYVFSHSLCATGIYNSSTACVCVCASALFPPNPKSKQFANKISIIVETTSKKKSIPIE